MDQDLVIYAREHTSPESVILHRLNRETHLTQVYPQMLAGSLQGMLLKMISLMIRPERILEIGTFTGYSAICLAEGFSNPGSRITDHGSGTGHRVSGILHTIEQNPELEPIISKYLNESSMATSVVLHIGDAMEVIPSLEETWDLVYIDADKARYVDYYNLVLPHVRPGGFILADNVLWDGKVLNPPEKQDRDTKGIVAFNELVQNDTRVENLLLPVRDGLTIIRKLLSPL